MNSESVGKFFKKFWFLLWKDNSIKGWIFSLIVIFIFIKFVFFPLLSFATGTSLPLAIVESCSMYHEGNIFSDFNSWFQGHEIKYSSLNITEPEFNSFSFKNGFGKGDILFIVRANPDNLKIGDIILFNSGSLNVPVIHRIVNITNENGTRVFTTMGDNNNVILVPGMPGNLDNVNEQTIYPNQIIGRAAFRLVPYVGWIKLIFFQWQLPPYERGLCSETPSA